MTGGQANRLTGITLSILVAYEAFAYLTGRPTISAVCRRHPLLAHAIAQAWLLHVFVFAMEAVAEVLEETGEQGEHSAGNDYPLREPETHRQGRAYLRDRGRLPHRPAA